MKIKLEDLRVGMVVKHDGYQYLVGDVNTEFGVCDCCCPYSHSEEIELLEQLDIKTY